MISNQPDFQLQFTAQLVRTEAAHIAAAAARRLVADFPEIASRYRPQPTVKWEQALEGRALELAAAIGVGQPAVFSAQVAWAKAAFTARGVPLHDLRASLTTLERTLGEFVPAEDAGLVRAYFRDAEAALQHAPDTPAEILRVGAPHGRLAAAYLVAILEGDRPRAASLILEAADAGAGVRELYRHVVTPVMHEVGRMWHLEEITVAEEHLAAAATMGVMSQLMARAPRPSPRGRTLVAAAVEGNLHDLGARMVADLFELEGWRALYLGADVPADDLALAAADFGADLVALSAALPTQLPRLTDTAAVVRTAGAKRSAAGPPKVIVGGGAFGPDPSIWRRLGADAYAATAEEAVELGSALCGG